MYLDRKIIFAASVILSVQTMALYAVGIRRYHVDLFENDHCGLNPSIYSGKCKVSLKTFALCECK